MLTKFKRNKYNDVITEDFAFKKSPPSGKTIRYIIFPIIALCATAVVILIITVLTTHPTIQDDYFISDDTKTTISLTPSASESSTSSLVQTHFVYTYDGEDVSGLKTYFEYPDEESAKAAFESAKDQPEFKGAIIEGKYIVVTADESQFKGLTASDIKQQADALQKFQDSQNPTSKPDEAPSEPSASESD